MDPPPDLPSFPTHPSKPQKLRLYPFLFILLLISLLPGPATSRIQVDQWIPPPTPNPGIPYPKHCNHIVSESPLDPSYNHSASSRTLNSLRFKVGFFSGGDDLFILPQNDFQRSVFFVPFSARKTLGAENKYVVQARLKLRTPKLSPGVSTVGGFDFGFTGFWAESSGRLCMVGSGSVYSKRGNLVSLDAVLRFNYSRNSSIYGSLVSGVLENIVHDNKGELGYFEPVSILGVAQNAVNYEYRLIEEGKRGCGDNVDQSLSLERVKGSFCSLLGRGSPLFGLNYVSWCGSNGSSCSPLSRSVGIQYVPDFMSLLPIRCEEETKMQMLLSFHNSSNLAWYFPFDPNTTLVAEGAWDERKSRFCGAACRILNFTDSLSNAAVGDCSVKLSLSFPAVLSVGKMGAVVGQLWSELRENDPGYFCKIEFWSLKDPLWHFPGLRYNYTKIDRVRSSCANKNNINLKGKAYPNAYSSDMKILMTVKNSKGVLSTDYARASPLFVGDRLYQHHLALGQGAEQPGVAIQTSNNHYTFTNISYSIMFPSDFNFGGDNHVYRRREIFAEGTYDRETGVLCMIGCQYFRNSVGGSGKSDSLDCDIVINFKFSPLKSQSDHRLKGTVESTREKSDPLYFGQIDLWSRSVSVWRMDLEITMVLISNTLSCVFVGLQLYHVKKHPEVLSFISTVMLIILTMGHMVPLLLNFEALFKTNRNQQNLFFENGRWLEANEIVVRMVTMVAFLLEFRLLQLSWSARKGDENQKGVWASEKKVLYVSVSLYVTGGLITWLVNRQKRPYSRLKFRNPHSRNLLYRPFYVKHFHQQPSFWRDLKSYAGLILDGFLLPQILFNGFYNSREKALAVSFYIGTTLVRLLPHAYDLYRGHSYARSLDWSYIYADHKKDFYSTAWDIIIPCGGLLFALLIFLQQRFGGQCILPGRSRESTGYEKVPTAGSVELQRDVQYGNFIACDI